VRFHPFLPSAAHGSGLYCWAKCCELSLTITEMKCAADISHLLDEFYTFPPTKLEEEIKNILE